MTVVWYILFPPANEFLYNFNSHYQKRVLMLNTESSSVAATHYDVLVINIKPAQHTTV